MSFNQIYNKTNSKIREAYSSSIFRHNPENRVVKDIWVSSKIDLSDKTLNDIVRLTGEQRSTCRGEYEEYITECWEGKGEYFIDCQYYGFGEGMNILIEYIGDNHENY